MLPWRPPSYSWERERQLNLFDFAVDFLETRAS
jgi:hypothetical protein